SRTGRRAREPSEPLARGPLVKNCLVVPWTPSSLKMESPENPVRFKVERGIQNDRKWKEVSTRDWSDWDELQAWTDARMVEEARRRVCPATGTTVEEAWEAEKRYLSPVPYLPEPFDVAVTRTVDEDCTVAFEARRYSVPFAWF